MVRFARGFVKTDTAAEDVVQDTWAVVLQDIDRFEGRSALRSWIFGILGNLARTRAAKDGRCVPLSALQPDDGESAVDASEFHPDSHPRWAGHWAKAPEPWPEARLLSREALAYIRDAIERLPEGQRAVIRLRDGTQVTLAPQSRLRYPADYGTARRELYLDGEAYFQVTPDSQRPLRVHTAASVTEDLGTAFVVRAYADQVATEVVVAEGRVALWRADTAAASRPALLLGARDLGRLEQGGGATVRRGVDLARQLAWTRGVLSFDGTPLGEVVRTLERWYNVEIRVADSALAARRLTATFQNESIDLVLQRIALTVGLRVERADGSVILLRNGR